jgi:CBS domain-containing protein
MATEDCSNERVTRATAADRCVSDAMLTSPKATPADGTVADLRAVFANPHVVTALVVDGREFVGVVHRDALDGDAADEQPARALARRDVPTIGPDAPLTEALSRLDARDERRLVVLDPDGRTLRGLLCLSRDRNGFCQG